MKPLSKEASAALSALQATDPTSADEARVRAGLERTLGVVVPAASVAIATTAATAQAAATGASVSGGLTAMSLGAKTVLFVLAVGVGSVVTVAVVKSSRGEEPRPNAPLAVTPAQPKVEPALVAAIDAPKATVPVEEPEVPAVVVAPAAVQPPAPIRMRPQVLAAPPPEVALTATVESPPPEPEVVTPPPPPPSQATYDLEVEANFPNCDAATELRTATSSRKLLTASHPEEAVWLLGAYQRRCPSGRWSDEAWAVRMAGLCQLGRNAEVVGLLQWFSTEYPSRRAAVVTDLRSSCSEDVLKHGEPSAE